ncbi:MAG: WD40 domain-containing protein, partial [Promethearchaeota archaeon]
LRSSDFIWESKGHKGPITSIGFSPNGRYFVTGAEDKHIKIWDYASKDIIKDLSGHKGKVSSVAISHKGDYIISGSDDKSIKIWDFYTGEEITSLEQHSDSVSSVFYSPIGNCFISSSGDQTVKVWDNKYELIQTFEGHSKDVSSVAITPDGKYAISGSQDGYLKIWGLDFGGVFKYIKGHSENVNSVAVSSDGKLAVSGLSNKTLIVWDLSDGTLIKTLSGHTDIISSVAFSPGGNFVVSASHDNTLKIWLIDTGETWATLAGHDDAVTSVAASSDKEYIVSGSKDKTIIIWGSKTGTVIKKLKGHSKAITSIDISPNSEFIVSGSEDNTINIWSMKKGKLIRTLEGHTGEVTSVTFSPDGQLIASGSKDQTVKIWKAETGEIDYTFDKIHSPVTTVTISTDGNFIACGTEDNIIRVWSMFEKILTSYYYLSKVNSAKFIPDRTQIMAGYNSGDVLIWDLLTEEKEELLKDLKNRLSSVEELIVKNQYSEAIEQLNYVLESADVFNFEELKSIAFEKLQNLRDPEDTHEIIKKILAFEFENQREITKAEMVNQLKIEISETEYYENLLAKPVKYEDVEIRNLEALGTTILNKTMEPTLYYLVVELGYKLKTAKKIGNYLQDKGFISHFRDYSLRETNVEPREKLSELLIFISYATIDAEMYRIPELTQRLKEYDEIREVLYWQKDMKDNIAKFMSDNLGKCNAVLLFCSENALESKAVEKEWTSADMMDKMIIPIFVDPEHMPPLLRSRLGIQFDLIDFDKNVVEIYNLIIKKCME